MTDPVNVPREKLEEVRDVLAERIQGSPARSPAHNARVLIDTMLEAAPKAEPVDGKAAGAAYQVIGALADAAGLFDAPEVQDALDYFSGDCSGEILPWKAPKVEQEPVICHHEAYQGYCAHCGVKIVNGFAVNPKTHPAPSSDEVLEALSGLIDRSEEVRNMLAAHPAMQGREHVSMGVAFNNAIERAQRAYVAKHKGPQS